MARFQEGTQNLRIAGVRTPTAGTDGANKSYVDSTSRIPFSVTRNGAVVAPSVEEVANGLYLRADGSWEEAMGPRGASIVSATYDLGTQEFVWTDSNGDTFRTPVTLQRGATGETGPQGISNVYWYQYGTNLSTPTFPDSDLEISYNPGQWKQFEPFNGDTDSDLYEVVARYRPETQRFAVVSGARITGFRKGPAGPAGADGITPNITASITLLGQDSEATVTRTGTNANPILAFGIPTHGVFTATASGYAASPGSNFGDTEYFLAADNQWHQVKQIFNRVINNIDSEQITNIIEHFDTEHITQIVNKFDSEHYTTIVENVVNHFDSENIDDIITKIEEDSDNLFWKANGFSPGTVNGSASALAGPGGTSEGANAQSWGHNTSANGANTQAYGIDVNTEGTNAAAIGRALHTEGTNVGNVGASNNIYANNSFVVGSGNTVGGSDNTVNLVEILGATNTADSDRVTIVGSNNDTSGTDIRVYGNNNDHYGNSGSTIGKDNTVGTEARPVGNVGVIGQSNNVQAAGAVVGVSNTVGTGGHNVALYGNSNTVNDSDAVIYGSNNRIEAHHVSMFGRDSRIFRQGWYGGYVITDSDHDDAGTARLIGLGVNNSGRSDNDLQGSQNQEAAQFHGNIRDSIVVGAGASAGRDTESLITGAIAIGHSAAAPYTNSGAIGDGAQATRANQLMLGGHVNGIFQRPAMQGGLAGFESYDNDLTSVKWTRAHVVDRLKDSEHVFTRDTDGLVPHPGGHVPSDSVLRADQTWGTVHSEALGPGEVKFVNIRGDDDDSPLSGPGFHDRLLVVSDDLQGLEWSDRKDAISYDTDNDSITLSGFSYEVSPAVSQIAPELQINIGNENLSSSRLVTFHITRPSASGGTEVTGSVNLSTGVGVARVELFNAVYNFLNDTDDFTVLSHFEPTGYIRWRDNGSGYVATSTPFRVTQMGSGVAFPIAETRTRNHGRAAIARQTVDIGKDVLNFNPAHFTINSDGRIDTVTGGQGGGFDSETDLSVTEVRELSDGFQYYVSGRRETVETQAATQSSFSFNTTIPSGTTLVNPGITFPQMVGSVINVNLTGTFDSDDGSRFDSELAIAINDQVNAAAVVTASYDAESGTTVRYDENGSVGLNNVSFSVDVGGSRDAYDNQSIFNLMTTVGEDRQTRVQPRNEFSQRVSGRVATYSTGSRYAAGDIAITFNSSSQFDLWYCHASTPSGATLDSTPSVTYFYPMDLTPDAQRLTAANLQTVLSGGFQFAYNSTSGNLEMQRTDGTTTVSSITPDQFGNFAHDGLYFHQDPVYGHISLATGRDSEQQTDAGAHATYEIFVYDDLGGDGSITGPTTVNVPSPSGNVAITVAGNFNSAQLYTDFLPALNTAIGANSNFTVGTRSSVFDPIFVTCTQVGYVPNIKFKTQYGDFGLESRVTRQGRDSETHEIVHYDDWLTIPQALPDPAQLAIGGTFVRQTTDASSNTVVVKRYNNVDYYVAYTSTAQELRTALNAEPYFTKLNQIT